MTSYHETGKKEWMRCRAVIRKGAGVRHCPIGSPTHRTGLQGIAASGGGVLKRWVAEDTYRETRITPNDDGTFEASTGKRKRVFTMDGVLISLKERLKGGSMDGISDEEPKGVDDWRELPEVTDSESWAAAYTLMSPTLRDQLAATDRIILGTFRKVRADGSVQNLRTPLQRKKALRDDVEYWRRDQVLDAGIDVPEEVMQEWIAYQETTLERAKARPTGKESMADWTALPEYEEDVRAIDAEREELIANAEADLERFKNYESDPERVAYIERLHKSVLGGGK